MPSADRPWEHLGQGGGTGEPEMGSCAHPKGRELSGHPPRADPQPQQALWQLVGQDRWPQAAETCPTRRCADLCPHRSRFCFSGHIMITCFSCLPGSTAHGTHSHPGAQFLAVKESRPPGKAEPPASRLQAVQRPPVGPAGEEPAPGPSVGPSGIRYQVATHWSPGVGQVGPMAVQVCDSPGLRQWGPGFKSALPDPQL